MGIRDRLDPLTGAEDTSEVRRFRHVVPARLRRWLPSLTLLAAAIAIIAGTQSDADGSLDVDVQNLWAAVAFLLFVGAATAWVWRKARGEGFEALRWRRLHRRVFWRAAAACLLGSMVALWFDAFWQWRADNVPGDAQLSAWLADTAHAQLCAGLSKWLAIAAAPLAVAEPFVWRLWPKAMRNAVRRARVAKTLCEPRRMSRLEIDPRLGATGRPEAFDTVRPREPSRELHRVTPRGRRPGGWTRAASDFWWRNAAITWDGNALVLTDCQGAEHVFPVVSRPQTAEDGSGGGDGTDYGNRDGNSGRLVTELVWFHEERYSRRVGGLSRSPAQYVLLLDAEGRRIAQMPAVGFTADAAAGIARAAGLSFAAYQLGTAAEDELSANGMLFPSTRRTVRIRAPQRVRG